MTKHKWERVINRDICATLQAWRCSCCGIMVYSSKPEETLTHQMSDCDLVIVRQITES